MNARSAAPIPQRGAPRLAVIIAMAVLMSAASFQSAWAQTVGAAASFAITGAAGVAANGTGSVITGDVGESPISGALTGFPAGATVVPPFGLHDNDGPAIAAQGAYTALFTALSVGPCAFNEAPQMSGASFGPGIHCFTSTADLAANGNMTLSGAGVYIFRVPSGLTANALSTVTLNGVDACNVFWQVGTLATLNGFNFVGNVVAGAGITFGPFANLAGRALAGTSVTLAGNDTVGGCSGGTVTVTKTTTGGDGTFSFTSEGLGPFDITTAGGTGTKTFTNVPPGPLSIAEIAPSGWTLTNNGCASVTVPAGGTVTCTVTNTKDVTPPDTVKVHILKYLNGATATAASAGGYLFPMIATWNAANLGGAGTGPYTLGTNYGGAANLYGADTAAMSQGADYTTSEVTNDIDVASLVLPVGGTCGQGLYLLLGYSTSSVSLADAALQPITPAAPIFTGLQADQYVIVWNMNCAATGTLNVTKTSVGGVGTFTFTGGPTGPFTITTTVAGTPVTQTFTNVGPGPYTITETGPSGWTTTYTNCTLVTVPADATVTCAVVNTAVAPVNGTLKVIKKTVGGNGTFTFTGPNGTFTITTSHGIGWRTISLPPGVYTVTETGLPLGWAPTSSTCSNVSVSSGLTVTCTVVNTKLPVCETTLPTVSVSSIAPGPPVVVTLKVQDTGSGIQSIAVIVATNATVVVPAFTVGTTLPVYVTATKIDQSQGSAVGLLVTDVCGNVTIFDPVTVTVNPGRGEAVMLTEVPGDETLVTIVNDGLDSMRITVNGQTRVIQMRRGETRTVDISGPMQPGDDNTIILEARGPKDASAVVTVAPPPDAAGWQSRGERRERHQKKVTFGHRPD